MIVLEARYQSSDSAAFASATPITSIDRRVSVASSSGMLNLVSGGGCPEDGQAAN
jgi:hypothetical protein